MLSTPSRDDELSPPATDGVELRLLWYNTFLLGGLELPLGLVGGGAVGGLAGAALGLGEIGLTRRAMGALSVAGVGLAFDGSSGSRLHLGSKPVREERATEIGEALARYGYDLAFLCEVFEATDRERILRGLRGTGREPFWVEGPGRAGRMTVKPSGLLSISLDRPLRAEWHRFATVGSHLRDADAWAAKGVLRTELDLGFGAIEIYSTHMFAGGGLLRLPGVTAPLDEGDRARIQDAQLAELVDFYLRTHRPECPAVLVGDFNIDGADHLPTAERGRYAALMAALGSLGMMDMWAARNGGQGCTAYLDGSARAMREAIAPLDASGRYCQDTGPCLVGRTNRIDYIFAECPSARHAVRLDLTRPRRVPFRRARETGGMAYLSDHIGLETTLVARPA